MIFIQFILFESGVKSNVNGSECDDNLFYLKFSMRTNVHTLVFHLTVADSIVSFVTMPLEAAWRYTMQVIRAFLNNASTKLIEN